MIENRLIVLLRKSKSLTPKLSESNFSKWKSFPTPSIESQSRFYYSRIIPYAKASTTGSFVGCGLRSLLQNNLKNFHIRSSRNFSSAAPVNIKGTEKFKLLVNDRGNAQDAVGVWLFVSAAWVYSMVVLGGIARLTNSGLSMTNWKFRGRIPLSNDDWLVEFENYKQSHEYKRANKEMNLDDFMFMYWMEYAHVLWGRSLAVMFVVPFSYFLLKRYITLRLGLGLSGLLVLGAGQGLIGWWPTKSGSEEPKSMLAETRASFYRVAAHSVSTFVVYSGLFWAALSVAMPESPAESIACVQQAAKVKCLLLPVSFIVGVTAISGAFVAEIDRTLSTSSRTIDGWVSKDLFVRKTHLVHQILSIASLFSIGGLWWWARKLDIPLALRPIIGSTVGIAAVQVALGTASLFSTSPVSLDTLHQAGALTLITLAIYLNHIVRRPSSHLLKTLSSVSKRT